MLFYIQDNHNVRVRVLLHWKLIMTIMTRMSDIIIPVVNSFMVGYKMVSGVKTYGGSGFGIV